jgi:hypothetical protein
LVWGEVEEQGDILKGVEGAWKGYKREQELERITERKVRNADAAVEKHSANCPLKWMKGRRE